MLAVPRLCPGDRWIYYGLPCYKEWGTRLRVDKKVWDVIVVGGGPGGASAARHCARLGLETLLLEKCRFPRAKVCAGGVTGAALREIGLPFPPELVEREGRSLRPRWGGQHLDVTSGRPFVYLVTRARFDQHVLWAARQAGAEVKEGSGVTGVSLEQDRVVVVTPERAYSASVVVGADGVRSRVGRAFRPDFGPHEAGLCLAADLPASPEQREGLLENGIEVRYGIPARGFGWIFPKAGVVSVGVGAARSGFRRPGPELLRHLNSSSLRPPAGPTGGPEAGSAVGRRGAAGGGWDLGMLRGYLRAQLVPFGGARRPVACGRVFLVGDAAGFADPFTGEGIRWACLSGRLAAEAASRGLKSGRLSRETTAYAEACGAAIDRDLAWARWLTRFFGRWPEAASRLFFRRPELFEGLLDVLRGELTYRKLILGLPGRVLRGLGL